MQISSPENGNVAICTAEVETERGTYGGIGDASPDNVARVMVPHLIRLAETRAKARALRDSINVAMVAVEELGPAVDEAEQRPAGDHAALPPARPVPLRQAAR